MNSTGLIAKVLLHRTNELKILLLSPLERTFALRQGFQPLSDYWFYLKLTLLGQCRFPTNILDTAVPFPYQHTGHGIAVSLPTYRTRQCRFPTKIPDTAVPFPYQNTGHGIAVSLPTYWTLQEPIGVNLTSNVLPVGCLTIGARSPLAPLKKGGTGVCSFVPLLKGDLGGSRLR
jgi:hypothetical protein